MEALAGIAFQEMGLFVKEASFQKNVTTITVTVGALISIVGS